MDTYVVVNTRKCVRCYKCVRFSWDYNPYGREMGCFILASGVPEIVDENPSCRQCEHEIDGETTNYCCEAICEHDAMKITRF